MNIVKAVDWQAEKVKRIRVVARDLMSWKGMTAYEKMVELCNKKNPPVIGNYVTIGKVKKSSINPNR